MRSATPSPLAAPVRNNTGCDPRIEPAGVILPGGPAAFWGCTTPAGVHQNFGPVQARSAVGAIPDSAQVRIGEQGYIHGIDGMLQQVARAFMGEAMPHVTADREMQARVGRAIGQEVAKPLWVLAGVAAAAGLIYLVSKAAEQPAPKRGRRRPFSQAP